MSIIGSNILAGASGNQGGYNINNSLRFRSSASASLSRTFGTPTNNKIFTFSGWIKIGTIPSSREGIFVSTTTIFSSYFGLEFNASAGLTIQDINSGGVALTTTQVFRDPSAWYHIVMAVDTTQATAANRIKLYVNGSQITSFSASAYPAQNSTPYMNASGSGAYFGAWYNILPFDGYLTEVNFIDGQALTPSSFGETDTTTGSWKPKAYTGTYGTNGFYLNFSDIATTSGSNAGLGKDFSGNANYWTTNNISVTAGTTYDAMIDSPTLTSATVANYCTLNPLFVSTSTISNANLQVATTVGTGGLVIGTIGNLTTGKYYWEATILSQTNNPSNTSTVGIINKLTGRSSDYLDTPDGDKFVNPSAATNDILGVAVDFDSGSMSVYKNNTLSTTVSFTSSLGWYPGFSDAHGNQTTTLAINFGQRPFSYTPPTGFVRLNTFNLPDSTIKKGNTVMDATLYTGTGASLSVTNAGAFKPDLVWVKGRSGATDHALYDSVRGTTKDLVSNSTAAETTQTTGLTAFGTGGFTVGALAKLNTSAATYVGWQWQAGQGSSSSNTSGTITSTVSVNATAGFSVVTYTGTGANATVGHGLGVAPSWIITKTRSSAAGNWGVYHSAIGATKALNLNLTIAATTSSLFWNNTAPTSSVFTVATSNDVNASATTYVAYCWAEIAGFSKFGSYTGNNSLDGPFVYCGFKPKFVMIKDANTAGAWVILDSNRATYNVVAPYLQPSATAAEVTPYNQLDFLSNGFKIRADNGLSGQNNLSGNTYIFMAFAENPFKHSNAR